MKAPLIIGAGFIGIHAAARLLEHGIRPRVLTRSTPEGLSAARLEGAEVIVNDASVNGVAESTLEGIDHVFYCAGGLMPAQSNLDPATDSALALPPLLRVLDALRSTPGAGLTYLSSGGTIYGNPTRLPVDEEHPTEPMSSYGVMKLASEKYVLMYRRLYGIPARILRCSNVYGEHQPADRGQGFVAAALRRLVDGDPIDLFGDGQNVRDWIYARDVCDVMISLAGRVEGSPVLNVGAGEGVSLRGVLSLLEEVSRRTAIVNHKPDRGLDVRQIVLDTTELRSLMLFEPVDLRVGLGYTYEAFGVTRPV